MIEYDVNLRSELIEKFFIAIILQHLENKITLNQVLNHWITRQGPRPENLVLIIMSKSKNLIAEAMGTFIMVFAGTGAIAIDALFGSIGLVGIAITFGFVIVALIYSFGHISGAHFNPACNNCFLVHR